MTRLSEGRIHRFDPAHGGLGVGYPEGYTSPNRSSSGLSITRRGVAVVAVLSALGGGIAGIAIDRSSRPGVACFTSDQDNKKFYEANTAYDAAAQVPGVKQQELNPNDIPMTQEHDGEYLPAHQFDHSVSTGLYGPDNCVKVD